MKQTQSHPTGNPLSSATERTLYTIKDGVRVPDSELDDREAKVVTALRFLGGEASLPSLAEQRQRILEEIEQDVQAKLQRGQGQKPVSTKEAIEKFLASSYAPRSPESKRSYAQTWAPFSVMFDIMPTEPEPIEGYVSPYDKDNTTKWNILVRLRCIYRFAEERLGLSPNPFKQIKVIKGQAEEAEPFTLEQARALSQAIRTDRERIYWYTMYGHGFRLGEVIGINYEDIRDDKVWLEEGKERKEWAPLLPEARDALLMGNGRTSGPVVVGRQGRVSDSTVQSDIKKWFERAGVRVKRASPHTLRHSFATHLYLADCDWDAVQLLMRHKVDGRKVTNKYLHLSPEQRLGILREKLARCGPIRMLNGSEPELGEKPDYTQCQPDVEVVPPAEEPDTNAE